MKNFMIYMVLIVSLGELNHVGYDRCSLNRGNEKYIYKYGRKFSLKMVSMKKE
jgi:hypothetical protein